MCARPWKGTVELAAMMGSAALLVAHNDSSLVHPVRPLAATNNEECGNGERVRDVPRARSCGSRPDVRVRNGRDTYSIEFNLTQVARKRQLAGVSITREFGRAKIFRRGGTKIRLTSARNCGRNSDAEIIEV